MDDRMTPRRRAPGGDAPGAGPPPGPPSMPPEMQRPEGRPQVARPSLYPRQPAVWRRAAAVIVGLVALALAAWWLDWPQALLLWALFSLFVLLWPSFPPLTPAEERARAWPFEA